MEKKMTPTKAIRKKCKDCTGGQCLEIKYCPILNCPLWAFRFGKNPNISKNRKNPLINKEFFKGFENKSSSIIKEALKKKL